ncbi:putative SP-containing membrane protein [Vairimorpha necatrix]|uniref:SP-containing membrane protein n=1 Tax=Vairimorpha necatrix TaxID=6039 RepID=A0AAX4JDN6_9MICR
MISLFLFDLYLTFIPDVTASNDTLVEPLNGITKLNSSQVCNALQGNYEVLDLSVETIKYLAKYFWEIVTNDSLFSYWTKKNWTDYKNEEVRSEIKQAYLASLNFVDYLNIATSTHFNNMITCYKDFIKNSDSINEATHLIIQNSTCFGFKPGNNLPNVIGKICDGISESWRDCFGGNNMRTIFFKLYDNRLQSLSSVCSNTSHNFKTTKYSENIVTSTKVYDDYVIKENDAIDTEKIGYINLGMYSLIFLAVPFLLFIVVLSYKRSYRKTSYKGVKQRNIGSI